MNMRLPEWVRQPRTDWAALHQVKAGLRRRGLRTVCESARCPNIHECFGRGSATFMILGNTCTRSCAFCAVPRGRPDALDPGEPENVAAMAAALGLRYVVITSVNRDELPDGGAAHWAETVRAVRRLPAARLEVLVPDFLGDLEAVATVLAAGPDVFNHNMETVARLYPSVRPQAVYQRSLGVLAAARRLAPGTLTKSGLMAGLGEKREEVEQLLRDLRAVDCSVVTIGQYLRPARRNLPVAEYVSPAVFAAWRDYGLALGFQAVFSGPMVRSSYMAENIFRRAKATEPQITQITQNRGSA
jgi:lipoic acid synthetase